MEDKIQEIMGFVDEYAEAVEDSVRGGDVICSALERETSIYKAIQSKLRELVERCSVREPLSEKEKRRIINNWFAEKWAQQQAVGVLHDYELAIKRKSNITNTTKE